MEINGVTDTVFTKCTEQNTQENLIEKQSEKHQSRYVSMELFDTFYDDYTEHKHYMNDILKNFPVSEDVKEESNHLKTKLIDSRLKVRV